MSDKIVGRDRKPFLITAKFGMCAKLLYRIKEDVARNIPERKDTRMKNRCTRWKLKDHPAGVSETRYEKTTSPLFVISKKSV